MFGKKYAFCNNTYFAYSICRSILAEYCTTYISRHLMFFVDCCTSVYSYRCFVKASVVARWRTCCRVLYMYSTLDGLGELFSCFAKYLTNLRQNWSERYQFTHFRESFRVIITFSLENPTALQSLVFLKSPNICKTIFVPSLTSRVR